MYSDFGGEVYLRRLAKVANCSRSSLDNWVESVENSSSSMVISRRGKRGGKGGLLEFQAPTSNFNFRLLKSKKSG